MCRFCESLGNKTKEIKWLVRSTYADDNICEVVNEQDYDLCYDCEMDFKIDSYQKDGNIYVGVEYNQVISSCHGTAIIRPFSEMVQFNYCPFCGSQISRNLENFDKMYYPIEINTKEDN